MHGVRNSCVVGVATYTKKHHKACKYTKDTVVRTQL